MLENCDLVQKPTDQTVKIAGNVVKAYESAICDTFFRKMYRY